MSPETDDEAEGRCPVPDTESDSDFDEEVDPAAADDTGPLAMTATFAGLAVRPKTWQTDQTYEGWQAADADDHRGTVPPMPGRPG